MEALQEPVGEQFSSIAFLEARSSPARHTSTALRFEMNTTISRGSLELCWNPSVGSVHNLLDHTVSVGLVIFLPRPSLQCEAETLC